MNTIRTFWLLCLTIFLFFPAGVQAITVNPTGVNIRQAGTSTAFLTFIGLRNQQPMEGTWCGEISANGACVPGTIFGTLPARSNLSTRSGSSNFTDIMTIPPSVARRAYQDALQGNSSEFFYVRRFRSLSGGPDEFVPVSCRMAGGGARSPLALTEVHLEFDDEQIILGVARGEIPSSFGAEIHYNGSGRLKGRWEVVLPGDTRPELRDLLPEGSLPLEERPLQRRYTQIARFDVFLPPTGKTFIPGPDPEKLPRGVDGLHLILLRVEATVDREAGSSFGPGRVNSGGVAGFPLPVLRYYVGGGAQGQRVAGIAPGNLRLVAPATDAQFTLNQALNFSWVDTQGASLYRFEVDATEVGEEGTVLSALVNPGVSTYTAPPWLWDHAYKTLRWRVQALAGDGSPLAESEWRDLSLPQ